MGYLMTILSILFCFINGWGYVWAQPGSDIPTEDIKNQAIFTISPTQNFPDPEKQKTHTFDTFAQAIKYINDYTDKHIKRPLALHIDLSNRGDLIETIVNTPIPPELMWVRLSITCDTLTRPIEKKKLRKHLEWHTYYLTFPEDTSFPISPGSPKEELGCIIL